MEQSSRKKELNIIRNKVELGRFYVRIELAGWYLDLKIDS